MSESKGLNSNGVQCKALILKTNLCHRSQPKFELQVMSHVYAYLRDGFWKRRNITLGFRKTGRHIAALTLEQMCRLFYLKRATLTVFGNKEKYRSCTWRSVLPPARPTDSTVPVTGKENFNSPRVSDEKKISAKLQWTLPQKTTSVGFWLTGETPGETPWKHTRHHHDVYHHVSFCVNYAAVRLYSGVSLRVNEQWWRIVEWPLQC